MFATFSRLFQVVGRPDSLVLFVLCMTCLLAFTRWWRGARAVFLVLVIVLAGMSLLPVTDWLAAPLERPYLDARLPSHLDGIIAINGIEANRTAETGELTFDDEAVFAEFMRLAHCHADARRVFAVGVSYPPAGKPNAAAILRRYFDAWSDLRGVRIEERSQRTADRILFVKQMMDPKPGETWVLVTPAWRALRNVEAFRTIGWAVIPLTVSRHIAKIEFNDFRLADSLNDLWEVMKEWVGLGVYRIMGLIRPAGRREAADRADHAERDRGRITPAAAACHDSPA